MVGFRKAMKNFEKIPVTGVVYETYQLEGYAHIYI
jgi:hypothetical protein